MIGALDPPHYGTLGPRFCIRQGALMLSVIPRIRDFWIRRGPKLRIFARRNIRMNRRNVLMAEIFGWPTDLRILADKP